MADSCDASHATFVRPDLGSFCRLDELGLQVVGQRIEPGRAVLACRVVETDEFARWCRRCGCEAAPRDSVTRRLAHEPPGWRPTTLLITIRRYRCTGCGHAWRQDNSRAAKPRAKLSYQHMIAAYREPDRKRGRELMQQLIASISHSVPTALREVITLGRTLKRRAVDVLAYFDHPGTSNGPTEAINGRLEYLRGSALGFRNLTN
jgi:transposase